MAFSPDGRYLLTSSEDKTARVWVWDRDPAKIRPHGQPLRHTGEVHRATFSRDGARILTAGFEGSARLWRTAPLNAPGVITLRHRGAVAAAVFSPDGRTVLVGGKEVEGKDGQSRLYDAATGQQRGGPLWQGEEVTAIALSNTVAATVGNEGTVWLWNAETGAPLFQTPYHSPYHFLAACAFSPDGKLLAVGGNKGRVMLLDVATGRLWGELEGNPGHVLWAVPFSPDGKRLLSAGAAGSCRVWDLEKRQWICDMTGHQSGDIRCAVFDPTGRVVLTCGLDQTARLWSADDGAPLAAPLAHEGGVYAGVFDPKGTRAATASADGTVRLWDVRTGRALWPHPALHFAPVRAVAFSGPDGDVVASGCDDGRARLWSAATGIFLGAVLRHEGPVTAISFSPDGKCVLTGSDDGRARLWRPPAAVPAKYDENAIRDCASALTGMQLQDGVAGVLSRDDWRQRKANAERTGVLAWAAAQAAPR